MAGKSVLRKVWRQRTGRLGLSIVIAGANEGHCSADLENIALIYKYIFMEKILLAIDAINIDANTLDFACNIAQLTHSQLTGIFLENTQERTRFAGTHVYSDGFSGTLLTATGPDMEELANRCDDNIRVFKETCNKKNVRYLVHRDRGIPINEIIRESRFADLMILDAKTSFVMQDEAAPTGFAKKVLMGAECPVIVAPERFTSIGEIVFTYDGSASSVFAIKQFTHLFPQLDEKAATLLYINEGDRQAIEDRRDIANWLSVHFSVINIVSLDGDLKTTLFEYLDSKMFTIVVMGAYGRSAISQFFKRSSADTVIQALDLPVFIAHR